MGSEPPPLQANGSLPLFQCFLLPKLYVPQFLVSNMFSVKTEKILYKTSEASNFENKLKIFW